LTARSTCSVTSRATSCPISRSSSSA
jgi:hypothetical protein